MPQPYELTVSQAAKQINEKKLSPVDLAQSLLERIDATDKDLQAWVTIDREEVLTTAKQREDEARQGKSRGLLHGVPVGLKDIFYTAGMKTAAGSKVYADFVPDFDATSVAKIKEAGGIILGKAVTTEFATSDPSPTFNPWNFEHTPGGSSSGSSVAVATKTVGAALGSQTGGSTCRPAAYNGIVGLKATYGRISRYGVVPVSWSLDHVGILVRTVEDAALMLQVISGEDINDPGSSNEPVPDFIKQMAGHSQPPRIGIVSEYYSDKSTPEVWAHTQEVTKRLAAAGAEIVELGLPGSFKSAHSAQRIVMNVECAAFHEQFHATQAEDYGPRVRSGMEMGMLVPATKYLQAQRLRRQFRQDMVQMVMQVDVVLTPTTPAPAPRDRNTTGDASFQVPWTTSGLPTVTLPSGLSEDGMPLAVQLGGLPFEEGKLLGAAKWCETALGVRLSPPNYS
ncbi:MAG: amidase [Chloroflexi bacterium]|nr:amidase [Chloroflexota bacterium]MCI0801018.1 amidase [Chloroflexota bacterium]MCI0847916.1 amidase [Chloroflexota bacterium]MCI0862680.1 amidase [Chloroflexota bacterium]MCI0897305.1 amidase [Chloroflexota bacterium]